MNVKSALFAGFLIGALAFAAGCADSDPSARASEQPNVSTSQLTSTPTPGPASETPTETPIETPPETTGEPGEPTDSPTPGVLPSEAAGRPLTLSSIFSAPDGWRDGRFDVADRKQVSGIGGLIRDCGESYQQTLELRLANNFKRLKLEFGQSNSSPSSEQTMQVQVNTNGQYRDLKSAKLNVVAAMDIDVQKVNALKIIVMLKDGDGCNSGSVEAVLTNMVLS